MPKPSAARENHCRDREKILLSIAQDMATSLVRVEEALRRLRRQIAGVASGAESVARLDAGVGELGHRIQDLVRLAQQACPLDCPATPAGSESEASAVRTTQDALRPLKNDGRPLLEVRVKRHWKLDADGHQRLVAASGRAMLPQRPHFRATANDPGA